jgi:WD40 repeat protein
MSHALMKVIIVVISVAGLLCLTGSSVQGQERVRLHLEEGKSGAVWDLVQSPDGAILYSCGRDSSAKSWNLTTGECIRIFRAEQATLLTSIALDASGELLAAGDMNGMLTVWSANSGILRFSISAHSEYITAVAMLHNEKSILTAGRDGWLRKWSLDDASLVWEQDAGLRWIQAVVISPAGGSVAVGGQDGRVAIHHLASGVRDTVITAHARRVMALHFSRDGRFLFSSGAEGEIKVHDMNTRAPYRSLQIEDGYARSLCLDDSGEQLLVGKMNGLIELWDWKKRIRTQKLPELSYGTMKSVFDGVGERFFSAHTDGAIRIWNRKDASLLLSMVGFSDGQWLSFTPDGYYDCSAFGDRYVTWRSRDDEFPLQRYKDIFRKPAIVEDVLSGGYTPGEELTSLAQPPSVTLLAPRVRQLFAFGSEALEVLVEAEARDSRNIERIRVLFNGRPVGREDMEDYDILLRSDTLLRIRARVPVLPGRNTIEVFAVNASRVRSQAVTADISVETSGQRNPDLYVLAVGADRYAPDYPDLRFAAVDAETIRDELARQQGGLYGRVYAKALTGSNSSKQHILAAMEEFESITSRDVLLLFFSGHGVRQRDGKGRQRYYFLPAGTRKDNVAREGLAWDDVMQALDKLSAGRVILLLDACHSGDVSEGASNEKVAASIAGQAGIVFTSSSGNEFSFEDASWGHGAFTKALLDGIRGAADFTRDDIVDWNELQLYVTSTVRSLTRGSQNPMVPRLEQFANFDFVRIR